MAEYSYLAVPPSPIPTGSGSRSAADDMLKQYIDRSLHVPELVAKPDLHLSTRRHDEINLRSLISREIDSVDQLLKSAREFGAFRIKCHGISGHELRSLVRESQRVFEMLVGRDTGYQRDAGREGNRDTEEIVWVRSAKERMDWAREYLGPEIYRSFSEKMEDIAHKLEGIAEVLVQIFVENSGKQFGKRSEETSEAVLSLHKFNHNSKDEQSPLEKNINLCDHVLSLHLPAEQCKYYVQSGEAPFHLSATPEVIVVTLGKQLEEWSHGEYKCALGEAIYQPSLHPSFSVELKYSSLHYKQSVNRMQQIISISDQILYALIILFLYKIFLFLCP